MSLVERRAAACSTHNRKLVFEHDKLTKIIFIRITNKQLTTEQLANAFPSGTAEQLSASAHQQSRTRPRSIFLSRPAKLRRGTRPEVRGSRQTPANDRSRADLLRLRQRRCGRFQGSLVRAPDIQHRRCEPIQGRHTVRRDCAWIMESGAVDR